MSASLTDKIRRQVRKQIDENFNVPDTPDLIPDDAEDQLIDIIPGDFFDEPAESSRDGDGNPVPEKEIIDTVSAFVDRPESKTYTIVASLPFKARVIDFISSQNEGSSSVSGTSGDLSVGDSITFTVSGATSDARGLFVQINIAREI